MLPASDRFCLRLSWQLLRALPVGCCFLGISGAAGPVSYHARLWQTDEGLPQNSVHAIAQTRDGYLWVGTHEGLARFDGVRFELVQEAGAPELKRGWITALCAARDGSLWVACDGAGLVRFWQGTLSHITETNGLPSNQTRCLLEDREGAIWVGTEAGLARLKDGKCTTFTDKHGLGDVSVRALCVDARGDLRIATKRGLSRLDKEGVISTVNFGLGTIANALRSVCADRAGRVWVTSNDGLGCLEGERRLAYGMNEGLPDRITTAVYEDRQGQLWVGTYSGLARLANGRAIPLPAGEGTGGDLVYTLFEDDEGNLWVGGRDGLYRLNPARFTNYGTGQGLTRNNVMSVCEDRTGAIWIGTWGGGVSCLKDDKLTTFSGTNGLTHDSVLSLHETRDGVLWVGMDFDGGLNRLKDGRPEAPAKIAGMINAAIRAIHQDRQGVLWIGTSRGLNVVREDKARTYTTANGLPGNLVLVICETAEGTIWVGTDGGLSRWDGKKFANFTTREGLSHNIINALYEDSTGTLWVGTRGGGLNRFNAGKFTPYTTQQGLFNDEIYEILEDDAGFFWMSCRSGIFRVRKQQFDDFDHRKIQELTCTAFGKADGLASVQCNGVAKPAGWKARDGRLWFPTIRGVVVAEPGIQTNEKPPPVVIEEVLADKKPIADQDPNLARNRLAPAAPASVLRPLPARLSIAPGRGELEIHFAALSLQAPEKNRFKYMLEGLDPGWIDANGQRVVRYNNLAPGQYRFRVIACNNDGVWNPTGAAVSLVLLPRFWQTWWFRLVLAGAAASVIAGLYRVRVARLREIEQLRIQIAANLHDDVGARLTKVTMVTEQADNEMAPTDHLKPYIQAILKTTREITQAMDEIVWTINPKNDTLDNLANYIFHYAQEYFQDTGTRCRLDFPAQLPDLPISTEARHNLFMTVKEALNNVLKHAAATEVRIGLVLQDSKIALTISDNGRGFVVAEARPAGNGLRNMSERLERIGGRLHLESQPGAGTSLRLEADAG